ncbi:ABC transporter ATP-binding protein [Synergistales bacterium]|nr:ABC transporter ATP-binding protein [Synergistales bacterium]
MKNIIELKDIDRFFMQSQALDKVSLKIDEGEIIGIVGHNGAGKSTLVNIITGTYPQTSGELLIDGETCANYDVFEANKKGIRTVFQELSLCPNLSVVENLRVFHPTISGVRWRARAAALALGVLDSIFPGHGISPFANVGDLTLGQRQTFEIAKAFIVTDAPSRLIILDEPTSALDPKMARHLTDYLKLSKDPKISCIYISHILDEVLTCTDRVVVMKNGRIVSILPSSSADKQQILEQMGSSKVGAKKLSYSRVPAKDDSTSSDFVVKPRHGDEAACVTVLRGEVVGLAGLAGHGQTSLLMELYDYKHSKNYIIEGPATFIAGDRTNDGIFPVWSIVKNMTTQTWDKIRAFLLINPQQEKQVAEKWQGIINIKTESVENNILSLSGGNQQKILFARCLESSSALVLMDDPTRGVDVETKDEIYRIIIEAKAKNRSFVWYTTEMGEIEYCDSVYVFKAGKVVAKLTGDKITEEEILRSSF